MLYNIFNLVISPKDFQLEEDAEALVTNLVTRMSVLNRIIRRSYIGTDGAKQIDALVRLLVNCAKKKSVLTLHNDFVDLFKRPFIKEWELTYNDDSPESDKAWVLLDKKLFQIIGSPHY